MAIASYIYTLPTIITPHKIPLVLQLKTCCKNLSIVFKTKQKITCRVAE